MADLAHGRKCGTHMGEPISVRSSMRTLEALPTVRGMGRAKAVEEPPAVPTVCSNVRVDRYEKARV